MSWADLHVLRWYLYTWIGYFGVLVILPVRSQSDQAMVALLALTLYALASSVVAVCSSSGLTGSGYLNTARSEGGLTRRQLHLLIGSASLLTLVGLGLLMVDRILVQNIDYSQGLALARQQWMQAGEQRRGISSVASMAGHLMTPMLFTALLLAYFHWERVGRGTRLLALFSALSGAFGISVLTGGRTTLLMFVATLLSAAVIRRIRGKSLLPGKPTTRILVVAGVAAMIVFSGYVFASRAQAGGFSAQTYTASIARHLGSHVTEGYYEIPHLVDGNQAATSATYLGVAIGLYMGHSFWTFERILDEERRPNFFLFSHPVDLLAKIGLVDERPSEWSQSGYFVPLPGALWYDYGWAGLFLGALIHGLLLGLSIVLLRQARGAGIAITFCLAVLLITYLAPFIPATELMVFPTMLLSFLILAWLSLLFFGRRDWLGPLANADSSS